MADGSIGNVNPNLLKKLSGMSAGDWKEERKRAIRDRILAQKALTGTAPAAANFLPADLDAPDDAPAAAKPATPGPSTAPARSGVSASDIDSLLGRGAGAGGAGGAAAKRPRDEALVETRGAAPSWMSAAVEVPRGMPPPPPAPLASSGDLKASILAKLRAKREAGDPK